MCENLIKSDVCVCYNSYFVVEQGEGKLINIGNAHDNEIICNVTEKFCEWAKQNIYLDIRSGEIAIQLQKIIKYIKELKEETQILNHIKLDYIENKFILENTNNGSKFFIDSALDLNSLDVQNELALVLDLSNPTIDCDNLDGLGNMNLFGSVQPKLNHSTEYEGDNYNFEDNGKELRILKNNKWEATLTNPKFVRILLQDIHELKGYIKELENKK